jgi:phosphonate transport system permease protein
MRADRRRWPGSRSLVLLAIGAAAVWAVWWLSGVPGTVTMTEGGLHVAATFLRRALTPALVYESSVPPGTAPLLWKAVVAANDTVVFAAAAMSLALVGGAAFGFLGSSAWWADEQGRHGAFGTLVFGTTRTLMAALRSIHELLWAVLLLAAFGISQLSAVLAIAIPYSAILGKVFSELLDEAPRDAARSLREGGASRLQAFLFGLLPRAFPDIAAYAFYRFECAVRSSAILGFFGFPTIGYYVTAAFENLHYGEVWTYLYVLFALVAVLDWWSGTLRRRFAV